jgi:hypothetical protein
MNDWSYLENPILNATEGSYKLAVQISNYHLSALKASLDVPFIAAMFAAYEPIHEDLADKYSTYVAQGGTQQGESLSVKQLLRLLSSTKIREWDVAIQSVYPNDKARYKELLPRRRRPFQNGKQSTRIDNVGVLSLSIGSDSLLTAVKADVDLFNTRISNAYGIQQGSISHTSFQSNEVEFARVAMCVAQYCNLGTFIQQYGATPKRIATYFDLKNIRQHIQVLFKGQLKALKIKCICVRTFKLDDEIELTNLGDTILYFYMVEMKKNKPSMLVIVQPGTKITVKASELGNLLFRFLMVYNTNKVEKGKFELKLL